MRKGLCGAVLILMSAGAFPARADMAVSPAAEIGQAIPIADLAGALGGIQAGLARQGPELFVQFPQLKAVAQLDLNFPMERRIAEELLVSLPPFSEQQEPDARSAWFQSLGRTLSAEQAKSGIESMAAERAKELSSEARQGRLASAELGRALRELRRLRAFGVPGVSKAVEEVSRLSYSVRNQDILSAVQRIADTLGEGGLDEKDAPGSSVVHARFPGGARRRNLLAYAASKAGAEEPFEGLFSDGNLGRVEDRQVFEKFVHAGDNSKKLGLLAGTLARKAGLSSEQKERFAEYFNEVLSYLLMGTGKPRFNFAEELARALPLEEMTSGLKAVVDEGLRRSLLYAQWEQELMRKLPDSPEVDRGDLQRALHGMLNELLIVNKDYYERTLYKLLALPKDSEHWPLLAYGEMHRTRARAVDRAAILFEPWEVRRWIYRPSDGVLTADDVVEYAERIGDLGRGSRIFAKDGYLDPYAVFSGLEYLRKTYGKLSPDAHISAGAIVEEELADLLIRGRFARLFTSGFSLVPHRWILSWVASVIHGREEFNEAFRGKLDEMIRRGYPGLPPRPTES